MAQWQLREVIGLQRQGSQQAIADEGDGVFIGVAGVHLEGAIASPPEAVGAEVVAEDPTKRKVFFVSIKVVQSYGTGALEKFNLAPGSGTTPPAGTD